MLLGSDPDGDNLSFTISGSPSHGSAQLIGDNMLLYTPNTNFFGDDVVSYMSNDGEYDSPLASITFHVVGTNDSPTASNIEVYLPEGTNLNLSSYLAIQVR